jgi:hypothetical protein
MSQKLLALFAAVLLVPVLLMAQGTGKIAGVVTDSENGQGLVGVNVYLEGTSLGAATDEDGYYVILGVGAGSYTLVAEYVGYNKFTVTDLRVQVGVTTNQDIPMTSTTLNLEQIVVTAEQDLVRKNVTTSSTVLGAGEIQQLPLRGVTNIIALQPSVVVQNGNVHIRGSRSDEVGYYVDGADVANPLSRNRATTIVNEAIEELAVESGAFDAEFGGANGGIVRSELRSGGQKFEGSLDWRVDGFGDPGDDFLGATSYGQTNTVATFGGPLFSDNIRFFAVYENAFQRDRDPRYWEPFSYTDVPVALVGFEPSGQQGVGVGVAGSPVDTVDIIWEGKTTPKLSNDRQTYTGTLLFDYSPVKLKFSSIYTETNTEYNATPIERMLNDRNGMIDFKNLLFNGKLTWVMNENMFLEARGTYFYNSSERKDPYFENSYLQWYNPQANRNYIGDELYDAYWYQDRPRLYNVKSFYFETPTNPYWTTYQKNQQQYYGFGANFTGQFGRVHELKAGIEAKQYTIRRYSVGASLWSQYEALQAQRPNLTEAEYQEEFKKTMDVDHYGYNWNGNSEEDGGPDGAKKPLFASFYVQDKLEYNDLILKLGVRFDYFDSDDKVFKDPLNPPTQNGVITEDAYEAVDPYFEVSPRIAMSFPASETLVFYTGYGRFVQMTQLQNIYEGRYATSAVLTGNFAFLNPAGRGLEPTETTNYEVGLRKSVGQYFALDINAFYRNIIGQIEPTRLVVDPTSSINNYNTLVNGTFATNKGVEIKFSLRRLNRLQGQLTYTYTDAQGTGSATNSGIAALEQNTEIPLVIAPLDWNQDHRGSLLLDYRFGKGDGGPVFEQFGANLIYTFNSGRRYTRSGGEYGQARASRVGVDSESDTRVRRPLEPINSSSTPFYSRFDLRFDKSFDIFESLSFNLYFEVLNLLDTKNVLNVYTRTGQPDDDGFINNFSAPERENAVDAYGEEFVSLYKDINIANGEAYRAVLGNEIYDTPRQVRLGFKLQF